MTHSNIRQAKRALDHLSADPAARALAEERDRALHFYREDLEMARDEGREEGMRSMIAALCQAFGIPVTTDRQARLQEMNAEKLEVLVDILARTRSWPSEH